MVWICRSNHTSPEHRELVCIPNRQSWAPHMEHLEQHQGSVCFESMNKLWQNPSSLSGFSSNRPALIFLLVPRTILIKVSGRQLWFFPRHFRGWPYCSHSERRLPSAHLWHAQWSSQQWTAWQSMNHGGLAQVPSLDFVTRRSDLSAIITTACNKFSNINCTVPTLEPKKSNTILPPPWLWLHVSSTMHSCVNCGLAITELWKMLR